MSFFDQFDLRQVSNLELLANQVVEGFIIGLHKSPFHGFSVEFAEHRLYNPGESTKNIDWKVYARTDKLFTKKFEEETNLRCQIVVDVSSSMNFPVLTKFGENKLNKLRFSALAAASLMNLLRRQRDAFGLSLFDEELIIHTKNKSSTSHYKLLLTYLDKYILQADKNVKTSASDSLHMIAESTHRRSLIIIFSDMFENQDQEKMFAALQHLKHNKHEVVLFHVLDQALEVDFEFENRPYKFIDLESGEEVKLQSNLVKEQYQEEAKRQHNEIKQKCLQYKIDYELVNIQKDLFSVLQSYLVKRSKMRV